MPGLWFNVFCFVLLLAKKKWLQDLKTIVTGVLSLGTVLTFSSVSASFGDSLLISLFLGLLVVRHQPKTSSHPFIPLPGPRPRAVPLALSQFDFLILHPFLSLPLLHFSAAIVTGDSSSEGASGKEQRCVFSRRTWASSVPAPDLWDWASRCVQFGRGGKPVPGAAGTSRGEGGCESGEEGQARGRGTPSS